MLELSGSKHFRQRIVLAILSGKAIKIKNIREPPKDAIGEFKAGVSDFEINFLKAMEKLLNGCQVNINGLGTTVKFLPGILIGGTIEHDCCTSRAIGYYLEAITWLAPFCKEALDITLKGVTNNKIDISVDTIKESSIPIMAKFIGFEEGLELKIANRGMAPNGGGRIVFKCPNRKTLRPILHLEQGKIKRIRGLAFTSRVAPHFGQRMIAAAKGELLKFIPDVYISSGHKKGISAGKSSGYGITLYAETTTKCVFTSEAVANPKGYGLPSIAEEVGVEAAQSLLAEIYRGGCVDTSSQCLTLLYMALGPPDVSKVLMGELTPYCQDFLNNMRDFLQINFKKEEKPAEPKQGKDKVIMKCMGIGFTNLAKVTS